MDPITKSTNVAEFRKALEKITWFLSIGKPESGMVRINTWEDWPGPEDPCVVSIHIAQQECYDSFFSATDRAGDFEEIWNSILSVVMNLAKRSVPYSEDEDSWHGPTTAVWHAGWTAALVALHLEAQREIPDELLKQWKWFCAGRWPCAKNKNTTEYVVL